MSGSLRHYSSFAFGDSMFKSLWAQVICWTVGFAAIGGLRQLIIGPFGAEARSNSLGAFTPLVPRIEWDLSH